MALNLPAILDEFDFDTELAASKALVPAYSEGAWTDTSNTDPGIVVIRIMLEKLEEWLYRTSVRYVPDALLLQLVAITGALPQPAAKAGGTLSFNLAVGTTLQAGFQVANPLTGQVYELTAELNGSAGGTFTAQATAVLAGIDGNVADVGLINDVRSTPSAGSVVSVTSTTPFDGGKESEGLEDYKARLPSALAGTTLHLITQFEDEAESFAQVARAKAYRATRPFGGVGGFTTEAGHVTMILIGPGGAAPSQTILDDVRDQILSKSYFNLISDDPTQSGLSVLGVRTRAVGVVITVVAKGGVAKAALKTEAEAAVTAYLNPITGGQDGTGFAFGRGARPSEIMFALESLSNVDYVKDETLVVSNNTALAKDEIVTAGTVTVTVVYDA